MKIFLYLLFVPMALLAKPGYHEPWGKDHHLAKPAQEEPQSKASVPMKIANGILTFYQHVISPANCPKSSFRPTSSRYMQLAIQRYGVVKGVLMGFDRLLRENDDEWVYRTIEIDNKKYKYDPAFTDKYSR